MSDIAVESGVVKETNGDKALIQLLENEICDTCSARILCRPGAKGTKEMLVFNPLNAEIGQTVEISEIGHLMLKLSLMQFGLPLLGLVLGIFSIYLSGITVSFISIEMLMMGAGIFGLIISGSITWLWSNYVAQRVDCVFEICSVKSNMGIQTPS